MQLSAKRNKEQAIKKSLWQIRDAIDAYKQASDDGLIKKSADQSGYPNSLQLFILNHMQTSPLIHLPKMFV